MKNKDYLKIPSLNEHSKIKILKEIAYEQLREDEHTKKETLNAMREWLKQNKDVENVRDDDAFLLRFLRTKKFSLFIAQQQLLKYLNFRQVLSPYLSNMDFLLPNLRQLVDDGVVFVSPLRDKNGCRVILTVASRYLAVKF